MSHLNNLYPDIDYSSDSSFVGTDGDLSGNYNSDHKEDPEPKRLYKSTRDSVIDGVAGGIGEYFNVDSVLVRILFVLSIFAGGGGIIVYIVLMLVIPEEPEYERRKKGGSGTKRGKSVRLVIGLVLISAGTFLLLRKFFSWLDFDLLLPLILMPVGLAIVISTIRR